MIRPIALAVTLTFSGVAAAAAPPDSVVASVEGRAKAAGFDGAILIGEADGTQSTLTIGTKPVDPRATWRWASITKQLAAVIAMQEVAAGRLDLDAPVARYWSDWRAPNAATIRIRDLLNHNSGLPQPDESQADAQGVPAFYRSGAASPADAAAGFCAGPPKAKPPAKFDYNNCDTIVLAEVLARITGKPFPALLRERIVAPLKLDSVGMFEFGQAPVGHVAPIGDVREIDGLINLGVNGASAGAYGTIADLWRFDHALLQGSLVPAAQRAQMWTAQESNGFLNAFQWTYPAPLKGCSGPVKIVERQGLVGGIELRNWLLPETGRALILFSRKRPTNLGDPWEGKGFAFDLLSAVACR
ncbi:beta-lactamase family protein [Sphingomonas lutea]|uniref:Beta-lactamase family protein n=1 Tax=Sphingomonas lutea TaxID=1045317 RepID=A0A7G9SJ30_9SPHN|nr:serine hydrolase domain-containing protein [Sphingomonas lutea]QNN67855.1 beta-lactamase family protein [Sphingomonas lutea]